MCVLVRFYCERHSLTFLSGFSLLLALYDLFLGANKHGWMDGFVYFDLVRLSFHCKKRVFVGFGIMIVIRRSHALILLIPKLSYELELLD